MHQKLSGLLTEENCKKMTGYSLEEIKQLTGIYGVHTLQDFHLKSHIKSFSAHLSESGNVNVDFDTNKLSEYKIQIAITEKDKYIIDEKMISTRLEGDIAIRILMSQVDFAQKFDFKRIEIHAYSEEAVGQLPAFNGSVVWGKYGFAMDAGSRGKFSSLMRVYGRHERTLFDLQDTPDGEAFWDRYFFNWSGFLSLNKRSKSLKRFYRAVRLRVRGADLQ